MTDPNGWPDASNPGVPLNPERDGCHWLRRKGSSTAEAWLWTDPTAVDGFESEFRWWTDVDGDPEDMARQFDYLGPCHTPAEVAALIEAARREELDGLQASLDTIAAQRDAALKDGFLAGFQEGAAKEREAWATIVAELAAEAAAEGAVIAPDGLLALVAAMRARGDA